ncbi:DUF2520 domain-containing protein [bacterium]|nr:DUF2520 domain-containing protein [bacterium]
MKNKKIGIIGYGNVGKTLEYNLSPTFDIIIKQYNDSYKKLKGCEIIIIAVEDRNIVKVLEDLEKENYSSKKIYHTSGGLDLHIFPDGLKNYGCFHFPLSMRKENIISLKSRYVLFQGNDQMKTIFQEIFKGFNLKIFSIDPSAQGSYHYICSLFSNIPFYFLSLGMEHLKKLKLPDAIGEQLFDSAYKNFKENELLTGPIMRKDKSILEKHFLSIRDKDERDLYKKMTEFFQKLLNEISNKV